MRLYDVGRLRAEEEDQDDEDEANEDDDDDSDNSDMDQDDDCKFLMIYNRLILGSGQGLQQGKESVIISNIQCLIF